MISPYTGLPTYIAINYVNVPAIGSVDPVKMEVAENDISYADYGIYAENTGLVVDGGGYTMNNVGTGITSVNQSGDVYILNYVIDNCEEGIVVEDMSQFETYITGNEITTKSTSYGSGIRVESSGESKIIIGGLGVSDPNIINSNSIYGIFLSGFDGGMVKNNTILIDPQMQSTLIYGIRAESVDNIKIDNNIIDKQIGTAHPVYKRAISIVDCIDYEIGCNEMNTTEYELQFEGTCVSSSLSIGGNKFNDHTYALVLEIVNASLFEDIGNNSISSGNLYLGTTTKDLFAINTNGSNILYYVGNGAYTPTSGFSGTGSAIALQPGGVDFSGCPLKVVNPSQSSVDENNFIVFPSPTSGVINLKLNFINNYKYYISLTDLAGKEILNYPINNEKEFVDCSSLAAGIYIISVFEDNKLLWRTKFLKVQ